MKYLLKIHEIAFTRLIWEVCISIFVSKLSISGLVMKRHIFKKLINFEGLIKLAF
jgi:hypothetical protein